MGTMALAPIVITFFNSHAFMPAAGVLRWICLGMLLRVIAWPMGFIILARGERKIFFWSEVLSAAGYVALVWAGVKLFKLEGTGIAFFVLYVVYCFVNYFIVRRLTGFRWTSANRKLWLIFGPLVAAVFASEWLLPEKPALIAGAVMTLAAGIYSLFALCHLISSDRLPPPARKILKLLKLIPSDTNGQNDENRSDRTGLRGPAAVVSVRPERGDGSGPGY
jgi:PST family polysaccharide transporter